MTKKQYAARRAVIVRRWAAYRGGQAQREIWSRRRKRGAADATDVIADLDEAVGIGEEDDYLVDLS